MADAHYRVVILTQKMNPDDGDMVEDVVSEDILAEFEDDQDGDSEGQKSYDYHNEIVRKAGRV